MRRLCGLWIVLPVLRKCVVVSFAHGVDRYMMCCLTAVLFLLLLFAIAIAIAIVVVVVVIVIAIVIVIIVVVTSVFSLADRALEKAFLDSGKLDLGLLSAGSNGIEP